MPITREQVNELCVEATSHCNLHCPQCPRFDENGYLLKNLTPAHINPTVFKNAFNLTTFPNIELIRFEGDYGDIMMHPDAEELIDHARTITNVLAVTNGSLRSTHWWSELGKKDRLTVEFSIDGLEDTNSIYRINADYKKVIKNAQAYINSGGQAQWKFIVFKHNQHQVEQAQQLAKELGFVHFYTVISSRNFFGGTDVWPVKIDGVFSHNLEMSDFAKSEKFKTPIETIRILSNNNYTPPECHNGRARAIYLNHLGHLLPCCMVSGKTWMNDLTSKLWMRIVKNTDDINIAKKSVVDILNGEFYRKYLPESWQNPKRVHHVCVSNCSSCPP